jgi:ATP-grasp domain, R2K clade family 3
MKAPFVVADVALTTAGDWILIELNDGQMSGLSDTDANELYSKIAKELST